MLLSMAGFPAFAWPSNIPVCVYTHTPSFLYPFTRRGPQRLLGHLCVWAIVNSATVNEGCTCLSELVFLFCLDEYPEVKLLCPMVVLFLIFWGRSILFSIVAEPIYFPTNNAQGHLFSTSSPTLVISCLFGDRYFDRVEVLSHWGAFDLHFPGD